MPTICPLSTLALIDTGTCVSAANGIGMFGVGGATGDGNAAKAGYHGKPGTFTVAVNESHAVPITFATTFVYFSSIGVSLGPDARISGVHGGPTI